MTIEFDYHNVDPNERKDTIFPGDQVGLYWGMTDVQEGILAYEERLRAVGLDPDIQWPEAVTDTLEAAEAMTEVLEPTPLQLAEALSAELGTRSYYKREDTTPVHSFKLRGAFNKIRQLTTEEKEAGVLAASAGNHAQGVARSAARLGITATIVMPKTTPPIKVEAVKGHGATLILEGESYDEAYEISQKLLQETGATFIHPFNDTEVIAGQGTIAKEILDEQPDTTHIFVPVGGGGLIAGVAQYAKTVNPAIKIIGVEPAGCNAMQRSVQAGHIVRLDHVVSFAEGAAVKEVGDKTLNLVQRFVDDIITVDNDKIAAAMELFHRDTRSTLEGAGALAIAGAKVYAENGQLNKNHVVSVICSGANLQFRSLQYVAERNEIGSNREAIFAIKLPEVPGALLKLCHDAVNGHNITEFNYRLSNPKEAHILVGFNVADAHDKTNFMRKLHDTGYDFVDLSADDLTKEHIRHMVGGGHIQSPNEQLYEIQFPERPGALVDCLERLQNRWNISLFHYRSLGGDTGRVLIGFEGPDLTELEAVLVKSTQEFKPVISPAARLFL